MKLELRNTKPVVNWIGTSTTLSSKSCRLRHHVRSKSPGRNARAFLIGRHIPGDPSWYSIAIGIKKRNVWSGSSSCFFVWRSGFIPCFSSRQKTKSDSGKQKASVYSRTTCGEADFTATLREAGSRCSLAGHRSSSRDGRSMFGYTASWARSICSLSLWWYGNRWHRTVLINRLDRKSWFWEFGSLLALLYLASVQ